MSLKSWFGFPVSPENLTPTSELICICLTAVAVVFLLVGNVIYKCTQWKNRGKKEDKTAERNSAKARSSGETGSESKRSKFIEAEDQIDGPQEKREVQNDVKEEVKTETVKTQTNDLNADVQQPERENPVKMLNEDLNTDHPELEPLKPDEHLKETRAEPELRRAQISTPKLQKSERLKHDMRKEVKKISSQLKLTLALTRMMKLEDKINTFCSGKNQSMENDLDDLKRKLQAKEKELENYEWLRNELIHGIKSLSHLKLALAIARIQKLEDKVDELLRGKNQSSEKDLQILQWKLEAKEKQLQDKEAAVLKLCVEQQNKEDDEENLQTLKNNSPNSVANEETAEAEQELQDEQQSSEDAELALQSTTDVLESRVAELEWQLQDEQRRREEAEKDLKDLKIQVVTKERKSSLSSDLDDLLKDIETIHAEMIMKDNDLQMLKKELETINKRLHQPSADRETMSQTIDELKQTQNQLEERNTEIRKLRKQFDHKLDEEKQRNENNLELLKKKFETQNQKFEDQVSEVQQQLKDEQQRSESLMEMNQEFKRQLSELQERLKEELKKKIQLEQQWRKEAKEEVEVLMQELESKRNQLKTAKEEESDVSAGEPSVPTEPHEAPDTV